MHAVYLKKPDGNLSLCWMTIEGRNVACVFQNYTEALEFAKELQSENVYATYYEIMQVDNIDCSPLRPGNDGDA